MDSVSKRRQAYPAATWFIALVVVTVPLAVNPWGTNIFADPQSFLLRTIVLALALLIALNGADGHTSVRQLLSRRTFWIPVS